MLFYALNVGEEEEKVREFLKNAPVRPNVLLDTQGKSLRSTKSMQFLRWSSLEKMVGLKW